MEKMGSNLQKTNQLTTKPCENIISDLGKTMNQTKKIKKIKLGTKKETMKKLKSTYYSYICTFESLMFEITDKLNNYTKSNQDKLFVVIKDFIKNTDNMLNLLSYSSTEIINDKRDDVIFAVNDIMDVSNDVYKTLNTMNLYKESINVNTISRLFNSIYSETNSNLNKLDSIIGKKKSLSVNMIKQLKDCVETIISFYAENNSECSMLMTMLKNYSMSYNKTYNVIEFGTV